MFRVPWVLSAALCATLSLHAEIPDRDFSGTRLLDRAASNFKQLPPPDEALTVTQTDQAIKCAAGPTQWTIPLDGSDRKADVRGERWSSATKWEGSALLVNTLVMGARDYTIMDRWTLARPPGAPHY